MVSLPGGGSGDSYDPIGVSCPTSTSCVAAGAYIHHRVEHVIVDEWSNS
jgi:hypothetical protein